MDIIIVVLLICLTVMFVALGGFITVMWVRYAGNSLKVRESFDNIIDQKDSLINEIINDKITIIDNNATARAEFDEKLKRKNADMLRLIFLNEQYQDISTMDIKEQRKLIKESKQIIGEIKNDTV